MLFQFGIDPGPIDITLGQTLDVQAPDASDEWRLHYDQAFFQLIEVGFWGSHVRRQHWLLQPLRPGSSELRLEKRITCLESEPCSPMAQEIVVTVHIHSH